jgi:hypothetical protein
MVCILQIQGAAERTPRFGRGVASGGECRTAVYMPFSVYTMAKEAIRQEVAAITPEMILKVMDNYRERLHQCINIPGRHLSDVLFKTRLCKTAFCR